ncbi:hypothetical protein JCGZ_04551 [Jatropha curcas]|uniref:Uncharacterized protein n=1 Tax=Jatropha curcas TaxID=180498 RepID=A0A067LDX7_JATCU|nr:hypothetical protein JCGZ_04551 [Jatropha curcas]
MRATVAHRALKRIDSIRFAIHHHESRKGSKQLRNTPSLLGDCPDQLRNTSSLTRKRIDSIHFAGPIDFEKPSPVPAQRYQEVCQQFGFARSYIARLYADRDERDLEIGRLRRHQSRQSSAVTQLQLEVDRLRMRLEVEGIPLDFSGEDDDSSSSDDAPLSPPPWAAAGPSRRRR